MNKHHGHNVDLRLENANANDSEAPKKPITKLNKQTTIFGGVLWHAIADKNKRDFS